jgi:hypothetical protein
MGDPGMTAIVKPRRQSRDGEQVIGEHTGH